MLLICDEKLLNRLDPVRVFAGADPETGEPVASDWASPGAQFRQGDEGYLIQVRLHRPYP